MHGQNHIKFEVQLFKYLSDTFPVQNVLKEGDALTSFFYGCASHFVVTRVQANQEILKLNGIQQLAAYT